MTRSIIRIAAILTVCMLGILIYANNKRPEVAESTSTSTPLVIVETSEGYTPEKSAFSQPSSPTPMITPTPIPTAKPSSTVPAASDSEKMMGKSEDQIMASYRQQLEGLQTLCSGQVQQILHEIAASVHAAGTKDGEDLVDKLQKTYLGRIQQAENECDRQFNQIVDRAQSELRDYATAGSVIEGWRKDYQQTKQQARESAISTIIELLL